MLITCKRCLVLILSAQSRVIGRQKMARSVRMLRVEQVMRTGLSLMQWTLTTVGFQKKVSGTHCTIKQVICAVV